MNQKSVTVIIPAKNEAESLKILLPKLRSHYPDLSVIVINDGSSDNSASVCKENNINPINHPYPKGNGAAVKSGLRAATTEYVLCMDADNQHSVEDIEKLFLKQDGGYDMVVGARSAKSQASIFRRFANGFYNRFASWMTGHKIEDLTSGFRVVNREKFLEFIHLLPNGFSYPTTITMAFFRAGYSVGYTPINANKRIGKSHIRLVKDGVRFLLIIFRVGSLYSPLKLFLPISLTLFATGISYYLYTYLSLGRFTNMSALFFTTSILVFLIGMVSEQITSLMYQGIHHK